jgi:U3 small nucleolar RNA-associated protein MPP10
MTRIQVVMGKLDALSHFHFAAKPVVSELAIVSDVAAVAMEEAVPLTVSAASMRLPGEVFKSGDQGAPKADTELSK